MERSNRDKSIDVIKDELNFALAIVRELRITDKDDDAWKNVFNLQKKFAKRNQELTEYQSKKRQKREEEKKNGSIFDSFLKSVNRNYQVPTSVSVQCTFTLSSVSTVDRLLH
jgi:hypothetical protein